MNNEEISAIQLSWNRMVGKENAVVNRFYDRLFELYPEYRPMFSRSEDEQRSKFITMLNLIVNGLEHIGALEDPLAELGRKHRHLNISSEDYEVVSKVLVSSIDDVSDKPLTDAEREAWMKGLTLVSSVMLKESQHLN